MVEAGAKEVPEEQMVQALERAHAAIKEIVAGIDALAEQAGKTKRVAAAKKEISDGAASRKSKARCSDRSPTRCGSRTSSRTTPPSTRSSSDYVAALSEEDLEIEGRSRSRSPRASRRRSCATRSSNAASASTAASSTRSATITIEVGVLPRTHGSCLFTRGETQALVTATLGTADDQQKVETVDGETWKRFMLHYNFPPFSVGEVEVPARPRPPRDRPRRAGRARARADDARPKRSSPTPSASSPRSSSRTARPRWRRCAAARWR